MTPIEHLIGGIDWRPLDDPKPSAQGLPHATHVGSLDLFGATLRCYRLNTGEAVIDGDDLETLFGGAVE